MKLIYIGNFDEDGISNTLNKGISDTNIKETLSNNFILEANSYFPERKKLFVEHPEWISDNTLNLLDNTTIKITYIDEGAGYQNAFGYYIYDTANPPKNVSNISDIYIIFPNASGNNKGGKLTPGDSILIPYSVTTYTEGLKLIGTPISYNFPSGKSVGFVIFANGWKGTHVNINSPRYFSDSWLNPEKADWLKYHTALVKSSNGKLIMGLEDLPRDQSYCDHDFNDLLLYITTDLSKISSGDFSDPHEILDETAPTEYEMGYKKIFVDVIEDEVPRLIEAICTLRIPLTSKIVRHKLSNKLRTDRAFVHSIIGIRRTIDKEKISRGFHAGKEFESGHSSAFSDFIYTKNAWVESELNTDENINADGIHFFKNKGQAINYKFDY